MREQARVGMGSGRGMMAFVVALIAGTALEATAVTWKVTISPAGGGTVTYSVSSPAKFGMLEKSASLSVNPGAWVNLTFVPVNGYRLVALTKNSADIMWQLDAANHAMFGPVSSTAHTIVATFELINPTGDYPLAFPSVLPAGLAAIYSLTGHYTGDVRAMSSAPWEPSDPSRPYDFTAAMDESGKLDAVGTVDGVVTSTGSPLLPATGKISTVRDAPVATVTAKGTGTYDGIPLNGSGTMSGPVIPVDVGGGTASIEGTGKYSGKMGGHTETGKNLPVAVPPSPDASRDWGLQVTLTEKYVMKGTKQVKVLVAKATLALPNGDTLDFAERTVQYSKKAGLTLTFSKGINRDTVLADKKSTVSIKKMTLNQAGSDWTIVGGDITYAFLGQKGKGKVMDFIGP